MILFLIASVIDARAFSAIAQHLADHLPYRVCLLRNAQQEKNNNNNNNSGTPVISDVPSFFFVPAAFNTRRLQLVFRHTDPFIINSEHLFSILAPASAPLPDF